MPFFYPLVCPSPDPCCKLCSQRADMTIVGPAAATQNLQAQFPVQSGYRLAEGFRLFLHQAGAVVKTFGAERSSIGQQADDPLPNQG